MKLKYTLLLCTLLFGLILIVGGCSNNQSGQKPVDSVDKPIHDNDVNGDELEEAENEYVREVRTVEEIRQAIITSDFLDATHLNAGIDCVACHGEIAGEHVNNLPNNDDCTSCHGEKNELADTLEQMDKWGAYNPHTFPHGEEGCTTCHKVHDSFENTCSYCHSVPKSRF